VPAGLVHLSGCAKGCAHPGPAPVALVAAEAGYGIVRGGRAGDAPALAGLTLARAAHALSASGP
ncbi:MAG: precorrin-3B synthase, partial [Defluviicoccus sp.]|nr:precorrin-3B synthase [Defluviicoccus sp.]